MPALRGPVVLRLGVPTGAQLAATTRVHVAHAFRSVVERVVVAAVRGWAARGRDVAWMLQQLVRAACGLATAAAAYTHNQKAKAVAASSATWTAVLAGLPAELRALADASDKAFEDLMRLGRAGDDADPPRLPLADALLTDQCSRLAQLCKAVSKVGKHQGGTVRVVGRVSRGSKLVQSAADARAEVPWTDVADGASSVGEADDADYVPTAAELARALSDADSETSCSDDEGDAADNIGAAAGGEEVTHVGGQLVRHGTRLGRDGKVTAYVVLTKRERDAKYKVPWPRSLRHLALSPP